LLRVVNLAAGFAGASPFHLPKLWDVHTWNRDEKSCTVYEYISYLDPKMI
jgi:hypothetical protein